MANISVVGRIVSDDIELKISANNRPYLRFDLAERTGKGAYARTQYYQVVAFGAIASQFAKRELHRGALINVEGVLELEDYLKDHSFFRTSKTTIINLRRTKSIRPEIGARLLLTMDNQEKIIVSRQYAGSIKHALGVK